MGGIKDCDQLMPSLEYEIRLSGFGKDIRLAARDNNLWYMYVVHMLIQNPL